MTAPTARGRLWLVPNTLDLGTVRAGETAPDLQDVLPLGAIRVAAGLSHWVVENARSARALLKRVEGNLLGRIPIAEDVLTNLAFGGPDGRTLYVTAGKTLVTLRMPVAGQVAFPQWNAPS